MKRYINLFFIVIMISISLNSIDAAVKKWKVAKNSNGIKIFTRDVEGSDLDEFMGITVIDSPVYIIMSVLGDVPAQPQWMHRCKVAKVVKVLNDSDRIVYNVTDFIWPTADREVTVQSKMKFLEKSGKIIIDFFSVNNNKPSSKGLIRMKSLIGSWTLEIVGINKTKVTYRIKADLGGSIPAFIANSGSKDTPFNTLKNFKRIVKNPKYFSNPDSIRLKKVFAEYYKKLK